MATLIFRTEAEERDGLEAFLRLVTQQTADVDQRYIGFNILGFDAPVLVTRCRLLGLDPPRLDIRKYGSRNICDVMADLTFNGDGGAAVLSRGQKALATRFGLAVEDDTSGADVAAMVAAGDYDAIARHCQADIDTLKALYRRVYGDWRGGILLDLETVAIDHAADYRAFVKPDGRLTDEKKIAADIDHKLEKAALDPYLCRICCLGYEVLA